MADYELRDDGMVLRDGEAFAHAGDAPPGLAEVLEDLLPRAGGAPRPTLAVGVKLASLARHVQEGKSAGGHRFDWAAAEALLADPEVAAYMERLDAAALLPVRR